MIRKTNLLKVLGIVIFVTITGCLGSQPSETDYKSNIEIRNEKIKRINSKVEQKNCVLCGEDPFVYNLEAYLGTRSIGLININNWEVLDLELNVEEKYNEEYITTQIVNSDNNASTIHLTKSSAYNMSQICLSNLASPRVEDMNKILCEDCIKEILKKADYDMAFIDFTTKELKPLQLNVVGTTIGDYYIHIHPKGNSNNRNELEILIFYLPKKDK